MEVKIENLVKEINGREILKDITYSFKEGHIYGIKGKNGSGKTLLLKCICGLIRPTMGHICIDNYELGKDISFPKDVGILIEQPGLIEYYSGFKNLNLVADINNRIDKERIREMMIDFDLDPDSKQKVKFYSLGMRQKLGVIMALMEDPKLILLDEPSNALDEVTVQKLLSRLELKKQEGCVIIIASHNKEELEYLSDQIIEIKDGEIIDITVRGDGK